MINILAVIVLFLWILRIFWGREKQRKPMGYLYETAEAFFDGSRQKQADYGKKAEKNGNLFLVLADGMGAGKLGKIASKTAVDTMISVFESYERIQNPDYFFRRAFLAANFQVQKVLEGRNGKTSAAAVILSDKELTYGLAGEIKVSLFRKGELIPISEGQTIPVLADKACRKGKYDRQKAIWAMGLSQVWNQIGQDGFREIETIKTPIQLKTGDRILLMTKGVYQSVPVKKIEEILEDRKASSQELAFHVLDALFGQEDIENSSIMIVTIREKG